MGGEKDHDVLSDLRQQIQEPVALFGVEAGGGFIDDDQGRRSDQGLGDAEALTHAAGKSGQGLPAPGPQVHLAKARLHRSLALAPIGQALEHGHVVQHVHGRDARIDAEVLW